MCPPPHEVVRSVSMMDMIKATETEPVVVMASSIPCVVSQLTAHTSGPLRKTIDESKESEKTVLASTPLSETGNVALFAEELPSRSVSINLKLPKTLSVSHAPNETKCGLRGSVSTVENPFTSLPQAEKALKRAMNVAAKHAKHSCRSCLGRNCSICEQGCLSHEPALLICTGSNCMGAKIRKGAVYYIC
jgi:hypothetical protein